MENRLEKKLDKLRKGIRKLDSVLVTFSGGIDSAFLLRICREELGEKAIAVTAFSDSYPQDELSMAKHIAKALGAKHITIKENDMVDMIEDAEDVNFVLKELAATLDLKNVLNAHHMEHTRSKSFLAARRAGLRSPLMEAGLNKAEIRLLAKYLGLPALDEIGKKKTRKKKR